MQELVRTENSVNIWLPHACAHTNMYIHPYTYKTKRSKEKDQGGRVGGKDVVND